MLNRSVSWVWIALALAAWGGWNAWTHREVAQPPGVLVAEAPAQTVLSGDEAAPFEHRGYRLTPLAGFALEARVLTTESYRFDRLAGLVPVDVGLGWGAMSDSAVLARIELSQSGRFMYWHVAQFPIPEQQIINSAANMHLIPATPVIARRISALRRGQLISLRGRLVEAVAPNGMQIRSSLRRDDTGAGACEVIWVEDLEVLQR
ncbi:hypothetical protein [Nevskia ramosa]|uniref:hypothetical protein n=1 Tax=Nevskia ramosa TaxID=64002 RepID=UPI0003B394C8|nr:hypothetical protein [Nevskia ramosa]